VTLEDERDGASENARGGLVDSKLNLKDRNDEDLNRYQKFHKSLFIKSFVYIIFTTNEIKQRSVSVQCDL